MLILPFKFKSKIDSKEPEAQVTTAIQDIPESSLATVIQIKVIVNASSNRIGEWRENILLIHLTASPEKGKANQALITYLSQKLGIAKSAIRILSGQTTRLKRVLIEGLNAEQIRDQLARS